MKKRRVRKENTKGLLVHAQPLAQPTSRLIAAVQGAPVGAPSVPRAPGGVLAGAAGPPAPLKAPLPCVNRHCRAQQGRRGLGPARPGPASASSQGGTGNAQAPVPLASPARAGLSDAWEAGNTKAAVRRAAAGLPTSQAPSGSVRQRSCLCTAVQPRGMEWRGAESPMRGQRPGTLLRMTNTPRGLVLGRGAARGRD